MRIDNPTADQLLPYDTVHIKSQQVTKVDTSGDSVWSKGWWIPFDKIDYITREDTLEVGDEFTLADGGLIRQALAIVEGNVLYVLAGTRIGPMADTLGMLMKDRGFRITKKASAQ